MSESEATGIDTRGMIPLYVSVFVILCALCFPWISIPALKYTQMPATYTFWELEQCVENIQTGSQMGVLPMEPLGNKEVEALRSVSRVIKGAAGIEIAEMLLCGILSYRKRKKSLKYVRFSFVWSGGMALAAVGCIAAANIFINNRMGRANSFINMTIHSYIQLTAWQYAQMILSVLMVLGAGKLLDTQAEYESQKYMERRIKVDRKIGKRTWTAMALILVAIPFVIFFGIFFLNDRSEIFIALCIIGLAMIPFFMVFEERKPQAREILLIAVMAAIAVVGRMAFFMIPQFKPMAAVVILAGVGLGAEAGFLTGAMAGFVSNFFFGQGPWTPWQMFSFGIIGFLAGILFRDPKKRSGSRKKEWKHKILLCVYGGLSVLIIYGLLMDTASVTMVGQDLSWQAFAASYATGFPFNVIHAVSTVIFLFFMAVPMERKLDRIRKKYGILEV